MPSFHSSLKASEKAPNSTIEKELKVTRGMIITWRNRWSATIELLNQIEKDEPAKLRKEIHLQLAPYLYPSSAVVVKILTDVRDES